MNLNLNADVAFGTNILSVEVDPRLYQRYPTGVTVFDDALGGAGLTPSVVTLFSGTPGAGKSTMCQKVANGLRGNKCLVLYNSTEESAAQIRSQAKRLELGAGFGLGQEKCVPVLLEKFKAYADAPAHAGRHPVLVVDSLQTMDDGRFASGRITSATSERALEQIVSFIKETFFSAVIIGQTTKSGEAAGTNKLRHMVDQFVHMSVVADEKHPFYGHRELKTIKNRFGSSGFICYMKLERNGFVEVARGEPEE